MVIWFNEDKETDWAMFGGANGDVRVGSYNAFAAWQTFAGEHVWVPPLVTHGQRIPMKTFFGK